jgi:ubiquinone/menaquinone biosynthesis C-methylase UbiE
MSDQELQFTGERLIPGQASPALFWEHIYRYRFALNYVKGNSVVDIASGEGYGTAALYKGGAKEIIGIDISEEACSYAKKKYGLDYRIGNAQAIPLESNTMDSVISFETIEHLESPELFLKECARLLKENGKLILSTPNAMSLMVKKDNEFHTQLFSLDGIQRLISKYFQCVKVFSQCPESLSILSFRYLACLYTPLNHFNIYKKITKSLKYYLCKHIVDLNLSNYYKNQPVDAILKKDLIISKFINPYSVNSFNSWEKETPMFYIFEISNPKKG